jgi:hypothetical protein
MSGGAREVEYPQFRVRMHTLGRFSVLIDDAHALASTLHRAPKPKCWFDGRASNCCKVFRRPLAAGYL